jgi:UDP-N-acetylmuramyl tripeptide synthase
MDERSSPRLYPYIQPDMLVCTNLFRDSCKRNAHAEYIFNILDREIPKTTKLILNADDPLSSALCPENDRVYYSIEQLSSDKTVCDNIVNDYPLCPKCMSPLEHDVVRYHHIGRVHCPNCDYASPVPDYLAQNVNIEGMTMSVTDKDGSAAFPLKNDSVINIYNVVTAVALLREMGLTPEQIRAGLDAIQISETRYSEVKTANGKRIIHHLAKAQNPIACSRAFENVRNASGKKAILLLLDDRLDAAKTVELKAWLYDTDFEFLKDDSIQQLLLVGKRHHDTYVRALLAGIPAEKIVHMEDAQAAVAQLDKAADTFFILYEMHSIGLAQNIREFTKHTEWATEQP